MNDESLRRELGAALLAARTQLSMTQEQAAPIAEVSRQTLSRWEQGESIEPLMYAVRLARGNKSVRNALVRLMGVDLEGAVEDLRGMIIPQLEKLQRLADKREQLMETEIQQAVEREVRRVVGRQPAERQPGEGPSRREKVPATGPAPKARGKEPKQRA